MATGKGFFKVDCSEAGMAGAEKLTTDFGNELNGPTFGEFSYFSGKGIERFESGNFNMIGFTGVIFPSIFIDLEDSCSSLASRRFMTNWLECL